MTPDLNDAVSFYMRTPSFWEGMLFFIMPWLIGLVMWLYWTRVNPVLPFVITYWLSKKKGRVSDYSVEDKSDRQGD